MKNKYKGLGFIARAYQFLGITIFGLGAAYAVALMVMPTYNYSFGGGNITQGQPATGLGLAVLVGVTVVGLGLVILGAILQLLLAVEENTRVTSVAMSRMIKKREE